MKRDVIEDLFLRYYNDALLYTVSLTRSRAEAEDIVSSAFFRALATADGEIESFKPWLFRVCRNLFLSARRRHSRFRTEALDERMADDAETLADELIRDEEYRALYRAIELLPAPQRELITLFYFENLPIKAIAEILGKSEGNIKVSLCRAREGLRAILGEGEGKKG